MQKEIEELRARLTEAEETIEALRTGAVDAVVVSEGGEHQVYSLSGADKPYRVYVERMQEGAVTVAQDGSILFCNQRFAEMLRLELDHVMGASLKPYLTEEAWAEIAHVFANNGVVVKHPTRLTSEGGDVLPVLLTAGELPLENQTVMCLVVTDLSAQEENTRLHMAKEMAESANMAKDHFLAVLSHELRTPLTPVLMALTSLEEDEDLREDVRQDLVMMRRNIELETKLIDDLLDLNRIATGKLKLEIGVVDLNRAVHEACEICRSQAADEGIRFEIQTDPNAGEVAADPSRLHQMLWNVLKNAVKFSPSRKQVWVSTRRLSPDRCEIRVRDEGIGIAADKLARIFDAFEQGNAGITRRFGGLGLGLAISKALVDLHGGAIRAESEGEGAGATFVIELLGRTLAVPQAAVADKPSAGVTPAAIRLLLAEDHPDTLRALVRLLSLAGFAVLPTNGVAGAVAIAEKEPFDLVVSDLGLADGDGYELMRRISSVREVPGIAMSGYGMEEDVRRSRDAGFSEHLVKPIHVPQLIEAIQRVIRGAGPGRL